MYNAIIAKIDSVQAHPNADKIQLATVLGEQVVVGLDVKVDDVGVYFPVDGQLDHEFCLANSLYNSAARSVLELGEGPTGFFDKNRRVRAQKFRGQKSEGFWIPLGCLTYAGETNLAIGQAFTEINGHKICNKYITEATKNAQGTQSTRKTKRGETLMFPKHYDTDQFRHKWEEIPEGSIIYLTEKLHGTSGRYGNVIDETQPKSSIRQIAEKVLTYFGYRDQRYTHLLGSRNVILEHSSGKGFYGSDEFRYKAVENIKLRKGETIFFELVGDVAPLTPIMPTVKVDKKEFPDIFKQYGPEMRYRYGCSPGENKLYVYRIIQANEDGEAVDLSWPQVIKRCKTLNLNVVPELGSPAFWHVGDPMKGYIEGLSHGPSLLDPNHIREGVAIRVETPDGRIYCLKEKSFEFKFLEGIVKSNEQYVDTEEAS